MCRGVRARRVLTDAARRVRFRFGPHRVWRSATRRVPSRARHAPQDAVHARGGSRRLRIRLRLLARRSKMLGQSRRFLFGHLRQTRLLRTSTPTAALTAQSVAEIRSPRCALHSHPPSHLSAATTGERAVLFPVTADHVAQDIVKRPRPLVSAGTGKSTARRRATTHHPDRCPFFFPQARMASNTSRPNSVTFARPPRASPQYQRIPASRACSDRNKSLRNARPCGA